MAPWLIATGIGLAGKAYQDWTNRTRTSTDRQEQRAYEEQIYERQRKDALEDWQRTTDYNSPEQQMQRLKEAGLNPKLAYGTLADSKAGNVRSHAPIGSTFVETPKFDDPFQSVLGATQAYKNVIDANKNQFDLDLNKEMRTDLVEKLKLENQRTAEQITKTKIEQGVLVNDDHRRALQNTANVKKTYSSILNDVKSREMTDVQIKQIDALIEKINNENWLVAQERQFFEDTGLSKTSSNFGVEFFKFILKKL